MTQQTDHKTVTRVNRVLGIDPGYNRCGFAVITRASGKEELLFSECFSTPATDTFPTRLAALAAECRSIIERYTPDVCALEKVYFTTNQKTAMHVAEVRGALILTAHESGLPVHEFGPNEVKVAVAGDGAASKRQVMLMVPRLIRVEKTIRYDDEYDAIAVALTAGAHIH